jgi:hypothetical protein
MLYLAYTLRPVKNVPNRLVFKCSVHEKYYYFSYSAEMSQRIIFDKSFYLENKLQQVNDMYVNGWEADACARTGEGGAWALIGREAGMYIRSGRRRAP